VLQETARSPVPQFRALFPSGPNSLGNCNPGPGCRDAVRARPALRNAVNSFTYQDSAEVLPSSAPAQSQLSSEPHSFSPGLHGRLLRGAWPGCWLQPHRIRPRPLRRSCRPSAVIWGRDPAGRDPPGSHCRELSIRKFANRNDPGRELKTKHGRMDRFLNAAFVRRGILSLQSACRRSVALTSTLGPQKAGSRPAAAAWSEVSRRLGADCSRWQQISGWATVRSSFIQHRTHAKVSVYAAASDGSQARCAPAADAAATAFV